MPARAISGSLHAGQVDTSGRGTRGRLSGRVLPVITSIIVVLPAPFGPMIAAQFTDIDRQLSALSALKPSNATVMSFQVEDDLVRDVDLAGLHVITCPPDVLPPRRRPCRATGAGCCASSGRDPAVHSGLIRRLSRRLVGSRRAASQADHAARQGQRDQHEQQPRKNSQ
jgi:hypothetical protein